MDRSQITPRGRTYLTVVCVVFIALALLAAGCTSKESSSEPASPASSGPSTAPADGVQKGDLVEIEYTGTLANGSVFDSSKDRGPFQFVVGTGTAIEGFDTEIQGMKVGEEKKFTLAPEQAYGQYDPTLTKSFPIDFIPPEEKANVTIGSVITLFNGQGYFPAKVIEINATNVTFDLNHNLAGQSLTFDVKLVNLTPAAEVEKMMAEYAQAEAQMPVTAEEPATAAAQSPAESPKTASGN